MSHACAGALLEPPGAEEAPLRATASGQPPARDADLPHSAAARLVDDAHPAPTRHVPDVAPDVDAPLVAQLPAKRPDARAAPDPANREVAAGGQDQHRPASDPPAKRADQLAPQPASRICDPQAADAEDAVAVDPAPARAQPRTPERPPLAAPRAAQHRGPEVLPPCAAAVVQAARAEGGGAATRERLMRPRTDEQHGPVDRVDAVLAQQPALPHLVVGPVLDPRHVVAVAAVERPDLHVRPRLVSPPERAALGRVEVDRHLDERVAQPALREPVAVAHEVAVRVAL